SFSLTTASEKQNDRTLLAPTWSLEKLADAPAKMHIEPALVYRYGKAIGDQTMMQFAAFEAKQYDYDSGTLPGNFGRLNR
ncbi:MAG: hypothetical protein GXO75_16915, partial [Calditrichaeota bacterium]|nr:hypothetical protein [Calditrichota bacterium]